MSNTTDDAIDPDLMARLQAMIAAQGSNDDTNDTQPADPSASSGDQTPLPTPPTPPVSEVAPGDAEKMAQQQRSPPAYSVPVNPTQYPANISPTSAAQPAATDGSTPWSENYFKNLAMMESRNNPNAQNPNSSAYGLYQITDPAYADMQRLHPNANYSGKNDPQLASDYTALNAKALEAAKIPVNDTTLYAAHVLGAHGAIQFLKTPPNTPVNQVLPEALINTNKSVFEDAQGNPLTVGQVYQKVQAKMEGPGGPDMGSIMGSISNSAPSAPTAAPSGPTSNDPWSQYKSDLHDYISQQPQMWDKLAEMQKAYLAASKPTGDENLARVINQGQQQMAAANAEAHANAGAILTGSAQPSSQGFVDALKNSQASADQQQQTRIQNAQNTWTTGAQMLQAQQAQAGQNLGLVGDLAGNQAKYGIEAAKFGVDNAKNLNDYIEKMIPNPETRAQLMPEIMSGITPSAPISQNVAAVNAAVAKAQAAGKQISAYNPDQMYDFQSIDPNDPTHTIKHTPVNVGTPEGQKIMQNPAASIPNFTTYTKMGAQSPQTNVTVNNGDKEGTGKGAEIPYSTQYASAQNLQTEVKAAQKLQDYLEQHGGTGLLTDSPDSREIQNALEQVGFGHLAGGSSARDVYAKLMTKIQNDLTLPQLKEFGGRTTGQEFSTLLAGSLGNQSMLPAGRMYLNNVAKNADIAARRAQYMSDQEAQAQLHPNQVFNNEESSTY